jgi:hypothetical protein
MKTISIKDKAGNFAEDKDIAVEIRKHFLRPELDKGHKVVIDFTDVEGATQSFVHAMIRALIGGNGNDALDRIAFKGCNESIKGVISIVVEYSQLDTDAEVPDARPIRSAK